MSKPSKARKVARTVLIVGEGDAEVCFLQHLKSLYVQRGSGVVVTLRTPEVRALYMWWTSLFANHAMLNMT
jgi:hypothetical protein